MKKPVFVNNNIYHLYNRGVEKRKVFMDDRDHLRFIHDLFEFNDRESSPPPNIRFSSRRPSTLNTQCFEVELQNIEKERKPRKLLVELLAFTLMPNHYHLLVRQKVDNGISTFMQKMGTGYTNYFNLKYERDGSLFQGRFKAVPVEREAHFIHLPYYIHLNPLDLVTPEWRARKMQNPKKAMHFLENYRWSSFLDYIGKKNFPSVTQRKFLLDFFSGPAEYKKSTLEWIEEMNLESMEDVTIDC
jgi:putative transposase